MSKLDPPKTNYDQIEVGDVVELGSGGPHMIVVSVANERADCEWFADDGTPQKANFALPCLLMRKKREVH